MGIINVTPDSYYFPSRISIDEIVDKVGKMLEDGADIIDIGALSTRPGAEMITEDEEWKRLEPALKKVLDNFPDAKISVDTWRPIIAERAIIMGAALINDISGGIFEKGMAEVLCRLHAPVVLMHTTGTPDIMMSRSDFDDVVREVQSFLISRASQWENAGVRDIIIDPGIGFGKKDLDNLKILSNLDIYEKFPWPVLIGLSRKKFIRNLLNVEIEESLNGSTALHMFCLLKNVSILRVHDVKEAFQCVNLYNDLNKYGSSNVV